jgi:hypothetical protein
MRVRIEQKSSQSKGLARHAGGYRHCRPFEKGIIVMGPSTGDPQRQVGVFNKELVATLPAIRLAAMEKVKWLAGEWIAFNKVPATHLSPA